MVPVDTLYAVPLAEFTRRRNELAARLGQAGRREEAAAVRRLRRPSVPVWAINALAVEERRAQQALEARRQARAQADDLARQASTLEQEAAARAREEAEAARAVGDLRRRLGEAEARARERRSAARKAAVAAKRARREA